MSLVDKFDGHRGDLVRFSNAKGPDQTGYVVDYSPEKVKLSNWGLRLPNGELRSTSFLESDSNEMRFTVRLKYWDSYEILEKCEKE